MVLGHWDGGMGGIVLGALTPFDHNLPSRVGNGEWREKLVVEIIQICTRKYRSVTHPWPSSLNEGFFWGQLVTERIKIDRYGINFWYYPISIILSWWIIRKWKLSNIGASSPELLIFYWASEICMTSESSKPCFTHIELEEEPQQAVKGCLEGAVVMSHLR